MRDFDTFYKEHYSAVYNQGLVGFVSRMAHRSLERPYGRDHIFPAVLELGAGEGQHLPHVRHQFTSYLETDVRFSDRPTQRRGIRVNRMILDATDLSPLGEKKFDRIIATCLLAHLADPEAALEQWGNYLKPGGMLSIYIPVDPGFLLALAQHSTVARKAKRKGYDYWDVHLREHRYQYPYLRHIVREVFDRKDVLVSTHPISGLGWNYSLWATAHCQKSSSQSNLRR